MKRIAIYIGLLTIFLCSCDCIFQIQGHIIDDESGEPLDKAHIAMIVKNGLLTRSRRIESMGLILDTIPKEERDRIIESEGNSEGWYFSIPSIENGRYVRHAPLETDSSGNFEIYYHAGFCPRKIIVEIRKYGYQDTAISSFNKKMTIRMKTLSAK